MPLQVGGRVRQRARRIIAHPAAAPHLRVASRSDVRAGLARGLAFLRGVQRANGSFPTCISLDRSMRGDCALDPSVFPAALIGYSLGCVPGAAEVRDRALEFLLGE